jgi:hypothetical protein
MTNKSIFEGFFAILMCLLLIHLKNEMWNQLKIEPPKLDSLVSAEKKVFCPRENLIALDNEPKMISFGDVLIVDGECGGVM